MALDDSQRKLIAHGSCVRRDTDRRRLGKLETMLETKYLTALFAVLLVAVGITGEVSGFRAFVCSRNSRDLRRRLVLIVGLYLAISLMLASLLTRLLLLSNQK